MTPRIVSTRCGEKEIIISEIHRLLNIYSSNGSFNSYATSLLSYIQSIEYRDTVLYKQPAPVFSNYAGFTTTLRIGLSQMVQNGVRIPADWALAWYCSCESSILSEDCGESMQRRIQSALYRRICPGFR